MSPEDKLYVFYPSVVVGFVEFGVWHHNLLERRKLGGMLPSDRNYRNGRWGRGWRTGSLVDNVKVNLVSSAWPRRGRGGEASRGAEVSF